MLRLLFIFQNTFFLYTGSLASADFSGAVFTCAHFQRIAQISSLCNFHYISEGIPSLMHFGYVWLNCCRFGSCRFLPDLKKPNEPILLFYWVFLSPIWSHFVNFSSTGGPPLPRFSLPRIPLPHLWKKLTCLFEILTSKKAHRKKITTHVRFVIEPERIYNPIMAMGFSAMFTFQLDNTKR